MVEFKDLVLLWEILSQTELPDLENDRGNQVKMGFQINND